MNPALRTPLNAMLGSPQLLQPESRQPLGPTQLGWVEQIRESGWHLPEMMNDVLDLSRIKSGNRRWLPTAATTATTGRTASMTTRPSQ
jgi:signal transduction histidine kinase